MPRKVCVIAAVSTNGVIGQSGRLPWNLPADLRHFRKTTWGYPILMGRKTFESIGRPLEGRQNLVLSRNRTYPGVQTVSSLEEALNLTSAMPRFFVIGGESLYTQALPHATHLYLTRIEGNFSGDTFFPALNPTNWREISREEHLSEEANPWPYTFLVLGRS
ncbi:Dihydrofolate reductase type 3 [Gammaproteobacteria bacterium]